jgi:competence ComEA-like helix-hairpin-helix protein
MVRTFVKRVTAEGPQHRLQILGGVPGASPNTANSGTLVNINTASVEEMRQVLHVSAATAQKIIDYRLQHGNYTSTALTTGDIAKAASHLTLHLVQIQQ